MKEIKAQQLENLKKQLFLAKVQKKLHESNVRQTDNQIKELERAISEVGEL